MGRASRTGPSQASSATRPARAASQNATSAVVPSAPASSAPDSARRRAPPSLAVCTSNPASAANPSTGVNAMARPADPPAASSHRIRARACSARPAAHHASSSAGHL